MTNNESVPKGYMLQKAAAGMDSLRQTLGAEKLAQVEDLANGFYEANRRVLDMAHAHGIVSDADYKKCLARGNEFTPIGWIMNDLLHPEHPRILVVSTEEGFNDGVTEHLNRNGYVATSTGTKRKVYEIIEEAKTFQPDIVILYQDQFLRPELTGVDLPILLFENFPEALFLVCTFGGDHHPVSEEAWAYARSHGCQCETVNIPFEGNAVLAKVRAWSANRRPGS